MFKKFKKYIQGISMLILLTVIVSCERDTLPSNLAPTVTTGKTDGIYRTGVASVAGNVTNPNGYSVKEYGIEYSLYLSFAESTLVKATKMDSKGDFSVTIDNLEPGVGYFYRTYVFSGYNTIYGETRNFTTATTSAPQFSAETIVSNINQTSFKVKTTLLDDGGSEEGILMSAFLYIPAEQDVSELLISTENVNVKSIDGFNTTIDNLYPNTRYAVRPTAVSGSGIGYGAIAYVTTTAAKAALLSTCTLSDTTTKSISVQALVLSVSTHPIVEAGFCYSSENKIPTIQNFSVQTKLQGAMFKATLTDLNAKTTYYIRAYVKDDFGTVSYSETIEYVVAEYVDVRTDNADEISACSARLWGYVNDNNVSVSERGFCWSTSEFQPEDKKFLESVTYVVVDANEEKYSYTLDVASNSIYYYCAYAKNSDGEVYYGDIHLFTAIEGTDLGLSVLWAPCNVGATFPEEYGGYYAWGETEEKSSYTMENYEHCDNGNYYNIGSNISGTSYDVAHVKWGSGWRMPTLDEIKELCNKCSWVWITVNGVAGWEVTGPNGNSIFIPAAGYRYGTVVYYRYSYGHYWSATLCEYGSYGAYYLNLHNGNWDWNYNNRCYGRTVRPVTE